MTEHSGGSTSDRIWDFPAVVSSRPMHYPEHQHRQSRLKMLDAAQCIHCTIGTIVRGEKASQSLASKRTPCGMPVHASLLTCDSRTRLADKGTKFQLGPLQSLAADTRPQGRTARTSMRSGPVLIQPRLQGLGGAKNTSVRLLRFPEFVCTKNGRNVLPVTSRP